MSKIVCNAVLPKALRPPLPGVLRNVRSFFSPVLTEKGKNLVWASKCKMACVFNDAMKIYFGS